MRSLKFKKQDRSASSGNPRGTLRTTRRLRVLMATDGSRCHSASGEALSAFGVFLMWVPVYPDVLVNAC